MLRKARQTAPTVTKTTRLPTGAFSCLPAFCLDASLCVPGCTGLGLGWARGGEGAGDGTRSARLKFFLHPALGKAPPSLPGAQSWARGWPRWALARPRARASCRTFRCGGCSGQCSLAQSTRCTCMSRTMVRHFSQLARLRYLPLLAAALLLHSLLTPSCMGATALPAAHWSCTAAIMSKLSHKWC